FPGDVQPRRGRVWSCPADGDARRVHVDLRQPGRHALTGEDQQLAEEDRADPAGRVDPDGVARIDPADERAPVGEIGRCGYGGGATEAVAPARQQADVATEEMEGDVVHVPSLTHRGLVPVVVDQVC